MAIKFKVGYGEVTLASLIAGAFFAWIGFIFFLEIWGNDLLAHLGSEAYVKALGYLVRLVIFFLFMGVAAFPNRLPLRSIWKSDPTPSGLQNELLLVFKIVLLSIVVRYGFGLITTAYAVFFNPEKIASARSAALLAKEIIPFLPTAGDFQPFVWSPILFAPITEELIYRGFILNFLLSRYRVNTAVLLSALVFGLLHGKAFLAVFLGGIYFGFLYVVWGRLYLCMLAHMVCNFVAVFEDKLFWGQLVIPLTWQQLSEPKIFGLVAVILALTLLFIGSQFVVHRKRYGRSSFPIH